VDERIDITNIVAAVGLLVDARNWDELTELFAPDVESDYTSLFGGEPRVCSREELVEGWAHFLQGFTRTEHLIGVPRVAITTGFARADAPVVAWHILEDPALGSNTTWLVGGRYEFVFVRLDGGWRIGELTLAAAWAQGNLDLPRIVAERTTKSPHHSAV
jgi:hypothetical protein